jgi:hypothetical protein
VSATARAEGEAARGAAVRGAVSGVLAGALAWIILVASGAAGLIEVGTIEALLALAPLVVVPLALEARRRLAEEEPAPAPVAWVEGIARLVVLPAALFAAASLALPPGRRAALVAAPWIAACGVIALGGVARALTTWPRGKTPAPAAGSWYRFGIWALLGASSLYLLVGAGWLVLSRLGTPVGGYLPPIPALTGVHFHYTMFALPTVASMLGRFLARAEKGAPPGEPGGRERAFGAIAIVLVIAPAILLTGWVLSILALKIVATLFLAAASAVLAALILGVSPRIVPAAARTLLWIAGGSVVVAMVLASLYVVGEAFEPVSIPIPVMATTHGVLNSLGFTLCGLLGWLLADGRALRRGGAPAGD